MYLKVCRDNDYRAFEVNSYKSERKIKMNFHTVKFDGFLQNFTQVLIHKCCLISFNMAPLSFDDLLKAVPEGCTGADQRVLV